MFDITFRGVAGICLVLVACFALVSAQTRRASELTGGESFDAAQLKALGMGAAFYATDNDDLALPVREDCYSDRGKPTECPDYFPNGRLGKQGEDLDASARTRWYWLFLLQPYIGPKAAVRNPNNTRAFWPGSGERHQFDAPGAKGQNVGGQNSFGYNALYMSPFGYPQGRPGPYLPICANFSAIARIEQVTLFSDATFYIVAPDVTNAARVRTPALAKLWNGNEAAFATAQGSAASQYWMNVGGSDWSYGYRARVAGNSKLTPEHALRLIGTQHPSGLVLAVAVDGHVTTHSAQDMIGNPCLWSTDIDGPHPKCPTEGDE